jgi:hypothetical protein
MLKFGKKIRRTLFIFPTSEMDISLDLSRRPLPVELNCEIFQCLKLPIQRKFIWGLNREMYGLNRRKMLTKVWIIFVRKNCKQIIDIMGNKAVFIRHFQKI